MDNISNILYQDEQHWTKQLFHLVRNLMKTDLDCGNTDALSETTRTVFSICR